MNDLAPPAPLTAAAYKSSYKPIWCPGCGDYSVLSSLTKALAKIGMPPERRRRRLGHRLLVAHPRVHDLLRLSRRARPRARGRQPGSRSRGPT